MTENIISHQSGQRGLFVPIDHDKVIMPKPELYCYSHILNRIEADRQHFSNFMDTLRPFMFHSLLETVPQNDERADEAFWANGYFSGDDARVAFSVVAAIKPQVLIEIGSGYSTRFMKMAKRHLSIDTNIICIDPSPRANVCGIADTVVRQSVLDVPLDFFDTLQNGDVLFHDGSHITFNGTDTVRLFLEIMPRLKSGVIVHLHDINLPYEYTHSFDCRGYSEQYMLGATILYSEQWKVIAPLAYLASLGEISEGGLSFWMEKQ